MLPLRHAWIVMVPTALLGTVFAATIHTTHEQAVSPQRRMGTTCVYTAGPKAGTTHDIAPLQMPVDTACNDGAGSTGVIVPVAGVQSAQRMGTVCRFTAGPKAGDTLDYAPIHAPVGTPCKDGSGNTGIIIAPPAKGEMAVNPQSGTVCKFTSGPRAGETQDYAPMQAPLNMPCNDGAGSSGTIIGSSPTAVGNPSATGTPESAETGSVCKFTAGPKAGTTHDYAPMHAPVNTPCDDGAGSSGTIIAAPQLGSVCKFTAGPRAGSSQNYAPMHAPINTPCDDGAGSSGAIVAAPKLGSVCKFTSGPKAGSTQDYAPMHAPINTPCDDGAGSSGAIIEEPKVGSICKFTSGPKAGTAHDYAPMREPLNTTCDDGEGSSGTIVASFPKAARASGTMPATSTVVPSKARSTAPGTMPSATASPASAAGNPPPAAAGSATPTPGTGSPAASSPQPESANEPKPNVSAPAAAAPKNQSSMPKDSTPSTGAGSTPGAPNRQLSSVCSLTSGPKAGTTYNFSPMKAAIGSPCSYGSENSGVVIAGPSKAPPRPVAPGTRMGSMCSFTSGPLAYTVADLAPKRGPVGSTCSDGHGSRGLFLER